MKKNILILLTIAFILFSGSLRKPLAIDKNSLAKDHELSNPATANPVQIIGTAMLGGLRIFVVDFLWLKITLLEANQDHHEILLTANLIGDLQPNYSSSWEYIGWLMAYNISSNEQDPKLKTEWVKSGLEHLNRGIQYNPGCGRLYTAFARTMRERMSLFHEVYEERYLQVRDEGMNPIEEARKYSLMAITKKDYKVHADRELFIENNYYIWESLYFIRNVYKRNLLWYLEFWRQVVENEKDIEKLQKYEREYNEYKKKWGAEGNLAELERRMEVAIQDLDNSIHNFPDQYDFLVSKENNLHKMNEFKFIATDLTRSAQNQNAIVANLSNLDLTEAQAQLQYYEVKSIILKINRLESFYNENRDEIWKEISKEQIEVDKKLVILKGSINEQRR